MVEAAKQRSKQMLTDFGSKASGNPLSGTGLNGAPGMLRPGNIDLFRRPVVKNPDGTISTVRSITVTGDKGEAYLIPTVTDDGRVVSNQEAIQIFQQTGKHLGIFADEKSADAYAQQLHNSQAKTYS